MEEQDETVRALERLVQQRARDRGITKVYFGLGSDASDVCGRRGDTRGGGRFTCPTAPIAGEHAAGILAVHNLDARARRAMIGLRRDRVSRTVSDEGAGSLRRARRIGGIAIRGGARAKCDQLSDVAAATECVLGRRARPVSRGFEDGAIDGRSFNVSK